MKMEAKVREELARAAAEAKPLLEGRYKPNQVAQLIAEWVERKRKAIAARGLRLFEGDYTAHQLAQYLLLACDNNSQKNQKAHHRGEQQKTEGS